VNEILCTVGQPEELDLTPLLVRPRTEQHATAAHDM
jgi:hypothetical protein